MSGNGGGNALDGGCLCGAICYHLGGLDPDLPQYEAMQPR